MISRAPKPLRRPLAALSNRRRKDVAQATQEQAAEEGQSLGEESKQAGELAGEAAHVDPGAAAALRQADRPPKKDRNRRKPTPSRRPRPTPKLSAAWNAPAPAWLPASNSWNATRPSPKRSPISPRNNKLLAMNSPKRPKRSAKWPAAARNRRRAILLPTPIPATPPIPIRAINRATLPAPKKVRRPARARTPAKARKR